MHRLAQREYDLRVLLNGRAHHEHINTADASPAIDPYVVNDLRLNASLHRLFRIPTIDLTLTVRNVLSEQYENNGWSYSFIEGGTRHELVGLYPQAPIHVLGGVTVRW
ncbi:MAG: hypothetical protein IPJ87_17360 [Flavobacteriales bacterium]|jgi:iron complex outermembrane receptor protein|nr:hypothetical protein [Flavobacteriales bacterium]MBK7943614.1 hypothetical protein [Flavobacteriales bacterium]MBK8950576.1 hypothetical protein [Flavobacteriales bacterium]MBK9699702.1 hypothetical protein [Flavobacteriales bacterium]